MKRSEKAFFKQHRGIALSLMVVFLSAYQVMAQDGNSSFGWANYDGQTTEKGPVTGGGNATPVKVTTFADLKAAVESSEPRVIHVMNDMGNGYRGTSGDVLKFKSNKTIIGVKAGLTVKCSFQISGAENIIVRNLIIRGPGNSNSEQNWDAVCIQGSKRIWFDHCTVMEGEDGNFDVVKGSDNVTASWCKFTYVSNGEHNLSNLIGSSDNESVSHGKLNVTYAYCWWENVNSRSPRTRYGKIHVLNCYYNNVGNGAYAGYMSNVRVEGCFFESNVKNPTGLISTGGKAGVFTIDCNVNGTQKDGYNNPFTPPYQYTKFPYSEVKSKITASKGGAGATLDNPISEGKTFNLAVSIAQGEGTVAPQSGSYGEGESITVTATPAQGWIFDHWDGDLSGSANPATVTMTSNKNISAYFIQDSRNYFTITKQASPGGSITQTPAGSSLPEGTNVTLKAVPLNGWKFNGWTGDHSGTDATYTITSLNRNISVSASFIPLDRFVYQAENGVLNEAVLETKNAGFTGTAYVNFNAVAGASLEIPVYADAAGEKKVTITFANGSGATRSLSISVNGTRQIADVRFEATPDWTTWQSKQVSINLPQGASTITLATINGQDGPNVDKITIDQSAASEALRNEKAQSRSFYNPVRKVLCIETNPSSTLKVSIFSIDGKMVFSRVLNSATGKTNIHLNRFNSGIYLIKLESDDFTRSGYFNLM